MRNINSDYLKGILRSKLSEKRYIHTLNVSTKALELGKIYNADLQKCELAGLLHDIMKENGHFNNLQIIKESDIILEDIELATKPLLHSIAGYIYSRDYLGVEDVEILNSVRYHTSGRKGMSLTEKIIFVADSISEDRDYKNVEYIRSVSEMDLDEALKYIVSFNIIELVKKNKFIVNNTVELYNSLLNS